MRSRLAILAVVVTSAVVPVAHAAPSPAPVALSGSWTSPPCATTSYTPGPTVTRGNATCTGVSALGGTLIGAFVVQVTRAQVDVLTGDTEGELTATLHGYRSGDLFAQGTLDWKERFRVDGVTGAFHAEARLTGGTGEFSAAVGCLTFHGFMPAASTATGGYSGTWFRRPPSRAAYARACPNAPR